MDPRDPTLQSDWSFNKWLSFLNSERSAVITISSNHIYNPPTFDPQIHIFGHQFRSNCYLSHCHLKTVFIGGTSHQPNYPLWLPLSLVAFTVCWIPHSFQGTARQGAEWELIKTINPLFSTAFEATFDNLQLTRTTLIYKMIKTL